ncbi:MAG: hypothetical protein CME06_04480 [Gemmatimonadetes bacterium]|nr:hypothetical protein [Gemmatimonadota bacterium]
MSRIRALLGGEWLAVRVQIGLGAVFVAAGWPKLVDPPSFAKNIWAYGLLPDGLINVQALTMPGIELVVGLALILGVWRRGAATVAAGLLLVFMVALSRALIEGNPVSCGCFDLHAAPKSDAELLRDLRMVLLRDVGLMAMALHGIWGPRRGADV